MGILPEIHYYKPNSGVTLGKRAPTPGKGLTGPGGLLGGAFGNLGGGFGTLGGGFGLTGGGFGTSGPGTGTPLGIPQANNQGGRSLTPARTGSAVRLSDNVSGQYEFRGGSGVRLSDNVSGQYEFRGGSGVTLGGNNGGQLGPRSRDTSTQDIGTVSRLDPATGRPVVNVGGKDLRTSRTAGGAGTAPGQKVLVTQANGDTVIETGESAAGKMQKRRAAVIAASSKRRQPRSMKTPAMNLGGTIPGAWICLYETRDAFDSYFDVLYNERLIGNYAFNRGSTRLSYPLTWPPASAAEVQARVTAIISLPGQVWKPVTGLSVKTLNGFGTTARLSLVLTNGAQAESGAGGTIYYGCTLDNSVVGSANFVGEGSFTLDWSHWANL